MRLAASIVRWWNGIVSAAVRLLAETRANEQEAKSKPSAHDGAALASDPDVVVFRVSDASSFVALALAKSALDATGDLHKAFVIDFADVQYIDRTEAGVVASVIARANHQGIAAIVSGARPSVCRVLADAGIGSSAADFCAGLKESLLIGRVRVLERQALAKRRGW